jgi:phage terminase small subunit
MSKENLTPKQQIFIEHYLRTLNATQSAIAAGYSKKTARQIGQENLTKPVIKEEIDKALERRKKKIQVKADDILQELVKIGFADVKGTATWTASGIKLKDSDDVEDSVSAAIQEVQESVGPHGTAVKIKMHDKIRALKLLGDHIGMWTKDEQSQDPSYREDVEEEISGAIEGLGE